MPQAPSSDKNGTNAIQNDIQRQIGMPPQQEQAQSVEGETADPNWRQSDSKSFMDIESSPVAIAELILLPPPPPPSSA